MSAFLAGGYLSLWGIAILLVWSSSLRLIHEGHLALAARGWVAPPRTLMGPMQRTRDAFKLVAALCCGVAALIVFADVAVAELQLPPWLDPRHLSPWDQAIRVACAWTVETFLLVSVAESPRWKMGWAVAWTAFAMLLSAWT